MAIKTIKRGKTGKKCERQMWTGYDIIDWH